MKQKVEKPYFDIHVTQWNRISQAFEKEAKNGGAKPNVCVSEDFKDRCHVVVNGFMNATQLKLVKPVFLTTSINRLSF